MEHIAQLFRALANAVRLQIMRVLTVLGEMNVSQLAQATGAGLSRTSAHLKILAAAGLIWRRRSGRHVGYRPAERAGNPVTAAALRVLRRTFRAIGETDPKRVARADQRESPTSSDAALFACFTAFTHPRRLQIIRHLAREGTVATSELAEALSMSLPSCLRHLDKLERRGFLQAEARRPSKAYALARAKGVVQRALLEVLVAHLTGA